MAIAGWLMIGVALLVIVSVVNNSWQSMIDQFRSTVGGSQPGGFNPSPGGQLGGSLGSQQLVPPISQQPRDVTGPGYPGTTGGTGGRTVQAPGGAPPTA